ncbi:hypothetical protein CEV31_0515 [Brucella thiophenivorans]|uniref:Uncharacterized protein n=1 Tax=Brucella thiophenivorans TaxID=571255 RepID=A0A256G3U0_9HYPH|nr:hypothetical protein CEV31_0515 [Brucella thiophenivorans]
MPVKLCRMILLNNYFNVKWNTIYLSDLIGFEGAIFRIVILYFL